MEIRKIVPTLVMLLLSTSLWGQTGIQRKIATNHKKTEKTVARLSEKNGNAFYLGSTHAVFSTVWSYVGDSVEVIKLEGGKVQQRQRLAAGGLEGLEPPSAAELAGLDQCLELDGDLFGYRLSREDDILEEDLPLGISCFAQLSGLSAWLDKVRLDIVAFELW